MTKHDYHWTFGNKVHISFPGGGAPVNEPNHAFSSNEGCATYSDAGGNLRFYTDGTILYDAAHLPKNSLSNPLGGNSSSAHSAIIVPPAGGGSLYHVFAVPILGEYRPGKLYAGRRRRIDSLAAGCDGGLALRAAARR